MAMRAAPRLGAPVEGIPRSLLSLGAETMLAVLIVDVTVVMGTSVPVVVRVRRRAGRRLAATARLAHDVVIVVLHNVEVPTTQAHSVRRNKAGGLKHWNHSLNHLAARPLSVARIALHRVAHAEA